MSADRLAAAKEEAGALESVRSALDAQAEVLELDDAIKESRRSRKARSS